MMTFDGKTVLITGGASGIGLATAKRFHHLGAHVAIAGRNEKGLDQVRRDIGHDLVTIKADVTSLDDIRQMVTTAKQELGKIDIAFVNAGIALMAPVGDVDEAFFDRTFDVNVKGAFFTAQQVAAALEDRGTIIFNTSVVNQRGMAMSSIYTASKAAVRSFVRVFANELSPRGIRVTAVSPGPVETPIYEKMGFDQTTIDGFASNLVEQVPLKRFGHPEEIAKAVTFLASADASFIQGEELAVDGGWAQV
ncbi:MAG: glucose 1-dehydrogenase [Pseudomonadota bacterium]